MENPFIKLLRSPNAIYIFDVNRNEVVPIDTEIYNYITSGNIGSMPTKMRELINEGYLSDKRVKTIEHPYSNRLNDILNRKIEKITLQITQGCNMRCSYCVYSDGISQRTHTNKEMSIETAKKAIGFFVDHSVDTDEVDIGFYGGEPLLAYNTIEQLIIFAEAAFKGKRLTFSITTNATLLNDRIISFFATHNVRLMISIDGIKEIHDAHRKLKSGSGSFDTVIAKIDYIHKHYPNYFSKIHLNLVVSPDGSFDLSNSIFNSYPYLHMIDFSANFVSDKFLLKKSVYNEGFIEEYEYDRFLALLALVDRIDRNEVPPISMKLVDQEQERIQKIRPTLSLKDVDAPGGPCIPGETRLFISIDGEFYPCERVSEISACTRIGNLNDGFNMEHIYKVLNVGQLSIEECRNCWAFRSCGLCLQDADGGPVLSKQQKIMGCEKTKRNLTESLQVKILLDEINQFY